MTVLAFDPERKSNPGLIQDLVTLGYLDEDYITLDCTYGLGRFWRKWQPTHLVGADLDPERTQTGQPEDFTAMRWADNEFDVVVFDPPYKLNGTPQNVFGDEDYGVGEYATTADRMELIYRGLDECSRVASKYVLLKCQDQVVSGKKVWQTHLFSAHMENLGWRLVDRLEVFGYRKQPPGRRQIHARQTTSSMLVFGAK